MATLRTIRLRIKGTKNIKQITRAMEAVSAVKMRKSQGVALAARPYATAALRLLNSIQGSATESGVLSPLLEKREVVNTLLVVVTSDKGLAGPFNANVLKKAEAFIKGHSSVSLATVGKKATEYFTRRGRTPLGSWIGYGDYAEIAEVEPVFEAVTEAFISGKVDEVFITYTNFLSAMKQEVVVRKLLPFSEEGLEEMVKGIVPEKGRFAEDSSRGSVPQATRQMEGQANESTRGIFTGSAVVSRGTQDPGYRRTVGVGTKNCIFSSIRITVGSAEDIRLKSIRWTLDGAAQSSDIKNVMCTVDGVKYGATLHGHSSYTSVFGNGMVIPKGLSTEVSVMGDIVGGAGRDASFKIAQRSDIVLSGETYHTTILPHFAASAAIPDCAQVSNSDNFYYDAARINIDEAACEYLFEPSPKEIFDSILPALLKIEIYHAILEANASEHSSRMIAMRNATDNAGELIKAYTVTLNKARQAAINKELAEITGGSEALTQ